jgi:hypothetical protein
MVMSNEWQIKVTINNNHLGTCGKVEKEEQEEDGMMA